MSNITHDGLAKSLAVPNNAVQVQKLRTFSKVLAKAILAARDCTQTEVAAKELNALLAATVKEVSKLDGSAAAKEAKETKSKKKS